MQKLESPKTLLIRIDRLGDLVLTLPVGTHFEELHQATWWIPQGLRFVAERAHPSPQVREISKKFSLTNFWSLYKVLRRERYEQALIFHGPAWVYLLIFLARIPVRAGRRSQWHSFVFLNRSLRQKRSQSEKNELSYNADLVEKTLGLKSREKLKGLKLTPTASATEFVQSLGLVPGAYVVIHPGMGGSALNWPSANYRQLIEKLLSRGEVVALTGTRGDRAYTDPLIDLKPRLHWLTEKLSGTELIDLLASAKWVLAPSTGVVHLSASLGTLTYGIYSPVRSESSTRWGPVGARVVVLEPPGCAHHPVCMKQDWDNHPCMAHIQFTGPALDKGS